MKEMQGTSRKSERSGQRSGVGDLALWKPSKGRVADLNCARR